MADIYGLEIQDPPDGWAVLEAIVLVKAIDDTGRETMFIRNTGEQWNVVNLGMIAAAHRQIADDVADCFADDGPDTDDDAST